MAKILKFKSCARGGEYNGLGAITPSSYHFNYVDTPANIVGWINSCYASDSALAGKVTGIGYGWQKFTIPASGKVKFTVRGAAGGSTGVSGFSINAVTGAISGNGNKPGRGAKLVGTADLKKNDILYMLVGMRGWCHNGNDWGGGGGGASVVLKDNPSGAYTFGPLNRKVDVLFVAGGGGGCYDSSYGSSTYWGTDADYNNGTNTNGGNGNVTLGGAGLTGAGGGGNGGYPAPSLLSGNPSCSVSNQIHVGGWGGGGTSYDGGGSGGGYSGGHSRGNGAGGSGGTSYIHPTLVTEISRGYATIAEDSERNLSNPWTAYGFIELELGRDEGKFILAKDADGYKYFNGVDKIDGTKNYAGTDEWELLPDQSREPQPEDYEQYGKAMITNRHGLKDITKFLISSPESKEHLSITGNANGTLVIMKNDFSMADVSETKSVTVIGNYQNVDIRFALSKDYGKTWQTYGLNGWQNIDITNKTAFQNNGYPVSQVPTIAMSDLRSYKAKVLRIAFCITQNGPTVGNGILSTIDEIVDLVGSWRHYTDAQATYEWVTDNQVKITFKEAGNYKVNYLDSINAGA